MTNVPNINLQKFVIQQGGGGRGIRIVLTPDVLEQQFTQASNEALNAVGDGRCFVEKYVERPRHIEVCLAKQNSNRCSCLPGSIELSPC